MNKIELYDILTLANNEKYTVLEITEKLDKRYFLLSPIDDDEEPNFEVIKIVEEIKEENKVTLKEVDDKSLLSELSEKFLNNLSN